MQENFARTLAVLALGLGVAGCSMGKPQTSAGANSAQSADSVNTLGQGVTVPTANAVVARIRNGLNNNVSPQSGNFAKALAQVNTNLPKVTDPTKATGFDQVQLLVYAACADLTTGSTPLMKSAYGVDPQLSLTATHNALVSAGVSMLDKYTAGLASGGPTSATVSTTLDNLVTATAADSTNTTKMAFVSVCIAANTAGTTLLGF